MSCCKKDKNYSYSIVENEKPRKYDKDFKGPILKRSCTDIICCIVFIVFIIGLIFITGWAYLFGDFNRLAHPTNSLGELCGVSPSVKNQPRLVFFNLLTCIKMGPALMAFGCPTKQICAVRCPRVFWSLNINTGRSNMVCEGGKDANDVLYKSQSIEHLVMTKTCAELVFPSLSIANRCIPDFSELSKFINNNLTGDVRNDSMKFLSIIKQNENYIDITQVMTKLFIDFTRWYMYVCIFFGFALLVSLVYLIFLRFFAAVVVWITLIMFVLIFIAGTFICFFTYYLIRQKHVADKYFSWYTLSGFLNDKFWLAMGIIVSILLVLVILLLIFLRNKIRIAIAIMKITSQSLAYVMGLIAWPFILFTMQMVVLGGCILLSIQLSTIRDVQGVSEDISKYNYSSVDQMKQIVQNLLETIPCTPGVNSTAQKFCTFVKYGTKTYVYIFSIYVLFMFFWLINFVKAVGQLTIAGTFASYYFAMDKPKDIPTFPVLSSLYRTIRYHLGSLAFGSLLLAIVQLVRWILQYLEQKAKESRNLIMEFILKCLKCCFWCLEKYLKFLNKNAYIMIAIYGQNYCSAAGNAFNLLSRNIIRVFVVDNVTDFVLFIGKLVIVGGFGVFSFVFFNGIILKESTPSLFYSYVPVIVTIVGTYIIATMFLQIFELGIETIFLCFCEDLERNDGSPEKPYFMNKELMSILSKENRKSKQISERESNRISERSPMQLGDTTDAIFQSGQISDRKSKYISEIELMQMSDRESKLRSEIEPMQISERESKHVSEIELKRKSKMESRLISERESKMIDDTNV